MVNPMDKVYRIKNYVDKNEVLGTKSLAVSKINKTVRKYPFGLNFSGYL